MGLSVNELVGVVGLAGWLGHPANRWEVDNVRAAILYAAREVESEPTLLGLSCHLLVLAPSPGLTGTSVAVTGVPLTSTSLIFATLQGHEKGVAVAGVVPDVAGSSFTIHLTKAATVSLDIAWFVVG